MRLRKCNPVWLRGEVNLSPAAKGIRGSTEILTQKRRYELQLRFRNLMWDSISGRVYEDQSFRNAGSAAAV
jgi:hypothetical protein